MNTLRRSLLGLTALATLNLAPSAAQEIRSFYPGEDEPHEGTWLQWPHRYTYGLLYQLDLDPMFVAMTAALVQSENVHVVAYNATERARIQGLLNQAGVPMENVDFLIRKTDDCWVRDNGPIFVRDGSGQLRITDWSFNGWGLDAPYTLDDTVPIAVANTTGLPREDVSSVVLEGGAVEVDGEGTLMATRSSILDPDRNPGLTQADVEAELTRHFGVVNFVWLDGSYGGFEDITDTHIDGVARFSGQTIVTMAPDDLVYYGLTEGDVDTLYAATNAAGERFSFLQLPLTQNDVVTTYGLDTQFRGSYVNFYAANSVVLVPTYADPNDAVALGLLQAHYPDRTVVGIDSRNLFLNGGMVHCVTQQQPVLSEDVGMTVGNGCPDPPLAVESYAPPVLGRLVVLGIHGLPATTSSAFLMAGSPLSFPLDSVGMSGCTLYSDMLVTLPLATAPGAADAFTLLSFPEDPNLAGVELAFQVGAFAPGTTAAGLVASNGLNLTLAGE